MKGESFLSDLLNVNHFEHGVLNIVYANCGSGKTTCAINKIAPLASSPQKAIYLIDTRNGCERLAQDDNLTTPYQWYPEQMEGHWFGNDFPDKVVVATYARFGMWVEKYPDFADNFEIIICDEAHNLVQFATFSPEPNSTSIARDAIRRAVLRGKTKVIAITATPDFLNRLKCPKKQIPIDKDRLYHYDEAEVIHYASLNQVISRLPPEQVGGLYVSRISQMKQYEALARECGRKPLCIWSMSNDEHPMTAEQLSAREYILDREAIPDEYDFFIFNASCETAINIRSNAHFFIAHNTNATHIEQSRGRFRRDLQTLYLLDNENGIITVPDEYLGRRLFKEEKEALRESIGVKNAKGRYIPWNELTQRLTDNGYTFSEGRYEDRPYIQIEKL